MCELGSLFGRKGSRGTSGNSLTVLDGWCKNGSVVVGEEGVYEDVRLNRNGVGIGGSGLP